MGIKEMHIIENTKEIELKAKVLTFADLGYWIRDLKKKFKKLDILGLEFHIIVKYYDGQGNRLEEYLRR